MATKRAAWHDPTDMTAIDLPHLRQWIGRTETRTDVLVPAHAARLAATLDRAEAPREGDELPPLWHWIYFTPIAPQSQLGPDGHPKLGGFMPPVPLPRRMWAGGRLTFHAPLRAGETTTRTSEIVAVSHKDGKQGALVFLTLRHSLSNSAGLAIVEEQDIVYREISTAPQSPPARPAQPAQALWRDEVFPDPVLLFRYSALTFNAHRIHYDFPYVTGEEGYPGLVVHGPLIATLLRESLAHHMAGRLATFSFRGQAPLFGGAAFHLCGRAEDTAGAYALWAEGPGGYVAMSAHAELATG